MAGIGKFVQAAKQSFGGGNWLKNWKEDKTITVWLHTAVEPVSYWGHQFKMVDVGEDRDNRDGPPKHFLRYLRFISPDPDGVNGTQHFRDKETDELKTVPDRDPFLLLREWLRRADHIALEDAIFQWKDPKDGAVETWTRGELSGLAKRGKTNFGHSLDSKQEFMFAVVDNADPTAGVVLTRESGLLGRKMGEIIGQQLKMLGDTAGDPLLTPYAFTWVYDKKAASPMNAYTVYKAEGTKLTPEIDAAITSEDPPDPMPHATVRDGDMEKVRAAFESAAQVELPLNEIFSEDQNVRLSLCTRERAKTRPVARTAQRPPAQQQRTAPAQQAAPRAQAAAPKTNGTAPVAAQRPAAQQAAPAQAPAAAPAQGGTARRRRVDPPPPKEPEVEMLPCDGCNTPLAVTATECPKCGAKYEVDSDPEPSAEAAAAPEGTSDECFSCGGAVAEQTCTNCGLEQGDPIPF